MRMRKFELWTGLALMVAAFSVHAAPSYNGFDLMGALVPLEDIVPGGPPRDGIPAIDSPRFIGANDAVFLEDDDRVLGVQRNGIAKAYPIAILNWHEIVNDEFAGEPIAVSYCPLAASGVAYPAEIRGKRVSFGTSGLLYNSNLVMYERGTGSLLPQLMNHVVSGPLMGRQIEAIPLSNTTWADWRRRHPDTLVLSTETGYPRDYGHEPYAGYDRSPQISFPVRHRDGRYHPKELVVGVELNGGFKAYPFAELAKTTGQFRDNVRGETVTVRFDPSHRTGGIYTDQGEEIPSVIAYWFAWYAFHPATAVFFSEGEEQP